MNTSHFDPAARRSCVGDAFNYQEVRGFSWDIQPVMVIKVPLTDMFVMLCVSALRGGLEMEATVIHYLH